MNAAAKRNDANKQRLLANTSALDEESIKERIQTLDREPDKEVWIL